MGTLLALFSHGLVYGPISVDDPVKRVPSRCWACSGQVRDRRPRNLAMLSLPFGEWHQSPVVQPAVEGGSGSATPLQNFRVAHSLPSPLEQICRIEAIAVTAVDS